VTTENCLGMKVEVGSSVIYFEYRTAEQGTAEYLPAMPLGRLEITLNVLSVPQLLFDPSALCMAGGYSIFNVFNQLKSFPKNPTVSSMYKDQP